MRLDRFEAVVPGKASADLDPQRSHRQVEFVVHDHKVMKVVEAVASHQHPHGLPTLVHVCLRKREHDASTIDARISHQRSLLGLLERAAVALRQQLDDGNTDVVARARVLGAGIAQTDDQQFGHRRSETAANQLSTDSVGASPPSAAAPALVIKPCATTSSGSASVVTPAGSTRSRTRNSPSSVMSEISSSSEFGMLSGLV